MFGIGLYQKIYLYNNTVAAMEALVLPIPVSAHTSVTAAKFL